ncbi:MAG: type IX secretion system membrane protein PorP/SprF [Saprospiraceae bacterium]
MKKILLPTLLLILMAFSASGQQDPMFTKYMFNSLVFNPAYAGAKDHLSVTLLHRDQWWGIDGAPKTQSLTVHTPLESDKVGVGLSVIRDEIGPTNTLNAMGSYAYRIPLGQGKLALGVQAGVMNYRVDVNELNVQNQADLVFMADMNPNMWLPNVGAGIHYYVPNKFYVGASAPHLLQMTLRDGNAIGNVMAQQFRHYYLFAGGAIRLNSLMVFKPSMLIKNVGLFGEFKPETDPYKLIGAPTEFDIDLSLMMYDALWVGVSFRSAFEGFTGSSSIDSGDIWAAYYLRNGFRIGVSYDYTLTQLNDFAQGTYEIMLGYEMNYKTKQIVTPRYF